MVCSCFRVSGPSMRTIAITMCTSLLCMNLHLPSHCSAWPDSAAAVQMFDSWGGFLAPSMWDKWSRPYIERIISTAKQRHPTVPIMIYANGAGGLIERMGATGADVVGLDWMTDIGDARRRLGPSIAVQVCHCGLLLIFAALFRIVSDGCSLWSLHIAATWQCVWTTQHYKAQANRDVSDRCRCAQGNLDPIVLFAEQSAIKKAVDEIINKAGPKGHVLNLGHGVAVGTPEENVKYVFDLAKQTKY